MKALSVIKIGGGLVGALSAFWPAIRELQTTSDVILVHGGGPQATAMARRLGHEPTIIHGRRVTSDLDLDIVRWTMRGEINLALSAGAQAAGLSAAGLAGADGGILKVYRRPPWNLDGAEVDFGWVGDVEEVDPSLLRTLLDAGVMPIVAPVGIDHQGQVYNVNADTVAASIATTMKAQDLLLVTDAGCLRRGPQEGAERVSHCDRAAFQAGVEEGWIQGGMRVKIQLALEAIEGGVAQVWVTGAGDVARRDHATRITA
jgi:acetylglutamate kinase